MESIKKYKANIIAGTIIFTNKDVKMIYEKMEEYKNKVSPVWMKAKRFGLDGKVSFAQMYFAGRNKTDLSIPFSYFACTSNWGFNLMKNVFEEHFKSEFMVNNIKVGCLK